MYLSEECHIAQLLAPVDIDGSTGFESDIFSMKNYAHASIIVGIGSNGGGSTVITVEQSKSSAGASAEAIPFLYGSEETSAGDTLSVLATATSSGFATHASNSNIFYLIEVDAEDLDVDNDFAWLQVKGSDPGASSPILAHVTAVLSGTRSGGKTTPTAIV